MKTKALLIVAAKFYGVHVDIEIVADPRVSNPREA